MKWQLETVVVGTLLAHASRMIVRDRIERNTWGINTKRKRGLRSVCVAIKGGVNMGNFRESEREKMDFDQTLEAARRIREREFKTKLAIVFMVGWLFGIIMICAYLGVKPLW
jgi:hypothetical protein